MPGMKVNDFIVVNILGRINIVSFYKFDLFVIATKL